VKIQQFMTEADAKEIYIQFLDENFPVIQILGMTYRVAISAPNSGTSNHES